MARTARSQLEGRHLLFGEYLRSWTNLNVHYRWIDGGKHVLAMFLNKELFWMNNRTIIEFGFHILWRIMEISEGVIRLGLRPRRITPSSISIILHKILSLIHELLIIQLVILIWIYWSINPIQSLLNSLNRFLLLVFCQWLQNPQELQHIPRRL